jgi:tripartite-type tricarboxylate transporter receptor subunit TctC
MRNVKNRRQALALGLTSLAAVFAPLPALGQSKYPDRPIRLIVPRGAGGQVDVIGRQWGERINALLGTVVIENMGGGGGTIGTATVARAQADGHTLLLGSTSDLVLNPVIMPQLSYDPIKDFAPIAIMATTVPAIVVNTSVPANTLRELVAYAKANPNKLSYGSSGAGTITNLCGELFKQLAGLPDIVHVPYKSAGASLGDLVAGHVPMIAANMSDAAIEFHKAGKVRILVVASQQKIKAAPDVPTAPEAGYPDLIVEQFMGLFAPAGTPRPVIEKLAQATKQVMGNEDFQGKLIAQGFDPVMDSDPVKVAKYLKDELFRWTPVLKAAAMKAG